VVFGRAHPCFLTIWFRWERGEALFSVAIMGHVLRSTVKSDAENDMETEFLMTSNGGSSLRGDEEHAWCFVTHNIDIGKWGDNTGEVEIPTLQGENPRSENWLCLAIV
jgi:hypothetical protein